MAGRKGLVNDEGLVPSSPWPEIRTLYETGVPVTALEKNYHVSKASIFRRVKVELWANPRKVSALARQILAEEMGGAGDAANPLLDRRARELIDRHITLREQAHSAAMEGMRAFKESRKVPSTYFEAESLMRMADKAAGIETGKGPSGPQGQGSSQPQGSRYAVNIAFLNPLPKPTDPVEVTASAVDP